MKLNKKLFLIRESQSNDMNRVGRGRRPHNPTTALPFVLQIMPVPSSMSMVHIVANS